MTQPSRVIYLPPGVVAGPPVQPQPASSPQIIPSGLPFDRGFWQNVLPGAIAAFAQQADCEQPLVEVLTIDGMTHYVKGVSGISDIWVALHTQLEDTDQAVQIFVPYQTIFRVAIHPCEDHNRRLGFILEPPRVEVKQGRRRSRPAAPPAEIPDNSKG